MSCFDRQGNHSVIAMHAMDHFVQKFAFMVRERSMGDIDFQKTSSDPGIERK